MNSDLGNVRFVRSKELSGEIHYIFASDNVSDINTFSLDAKGRLVRASKEFLRLSLSDEQEILAIARKDSDYQKAVKVDLISPKKISISDIPRASSK